MTVVRRARGSASANLQGRTDAAEASTFLGLDSLAEGLVNRDVFDAVLTPGDFILLTSWRTTMDAEAFVNRAKLPKGARLRRVRVVRDYGMFDRREAPQYFPPIAV